MSDKKTVEAVAVEETPKERTEAQQEAFDTFLARFANSRNKKRITKMLENGADATEFANEFGKSAQHKKYLAAEYGKLLKKLSGGS